MAFFASAVGVLQTLVVALGAGLGIWGVINLMILPARLSLTSSSGLLIRESSLSSKCSVSPKGKRLSDILTWTRSFMSIVISLGDSMN